MKPIEKEKLDKFLCAFAHTMSFGQDSIAEGVRIEILDHPIVCLVDLGYTKQFGAVLDNTCSLLKLQCRSGGEDAVALEVYWLNILNRDTNPLGEHGFFRARAYFQTTSEA